MVNSLEINQVLVSGGNIDISYEIKGGWSYYFAHERVFRAEYDVDLSGLPEGVAAIPFLSNILPIAWICDAAVYVKELDADFHACLGNVKPGYEKMYPMLEFKGKLLSDTLTISPKRNGDKSALLFSGGLDSFSTLVQKRKEKPALISIIGADFARSDSVAIKQMGVDVSNTAAHFDTNAFFVSSNMREIVRDGRLGTLVRKSNDTWWQGFQHGLGLLGISAPISYSTNISKIYISASYSYDSVDSFTCASNPNIDNYIKFCGCEVEHYGIALTRLDKTKIVADYVENTDTDITLHVCTAPIDGKNCLWCRKCYTTIYSLLVLGHNPERFGFDVEESNYNKMVEDLLKRKLFYKTNELRWNEIKNYYLVHPELRDNKNLDWIGETDFSKLNQTFYKTTKIIYFKLRAFIGRILRR